MNRTSLNKFAAIAAIASGLLIVISTFLTIPKFSFQELMNIKFLGGILFLIIGVLSLKSMKS